MAPPGLKCYARILSVNGNPLSVKRLLRHRLLRAVLALCLLGQLGAPALGFAQPCAMPGADDHAMAMTMDAHGESMAAGDAMEAMDCCQDDGPCLMAHCMAPPGTCGAEFIPAPLPAVTAGPAAPPLFPRALPRRHFRPPIAA
jgi:hypothetical protein